MTTEPKGESMVVLELTEEEARVVHHALSTTVELIDAVEAEPGNRVPPHAPLYGARPTLLRVGRRLDHERRHKGAVPNPNGPRAAT